MTAMSHEPRHARRRTWPLLLIAAPAAVAVWSGWVGLGALCGFGEIRPLPGIADHFHLDTAITLPVGVESYGAYALWAWLASAGASAKTRRFARASAVGALALGCLGQVAYHLLAADHDTRAPGLVVVLVACLPVVTLSFAAALTHLMRADSAAAQAAAEEARERAEVRAAARAAARTSAPEPAPASAPRKRRTSAPRNKAASAPEPPPGTSAPEQAPEAAPAPEAEGEPDELTTEARALEILAADPDISGSKLGRQLGKSDRYGRDLIKRLTPAQSGPEGGG